MVDNCTGGFNIAVCYLWKLIDNIRTVICREKKQGIFYEIFQTGQQ